MRHSCRKDITEEMLIHQRLQHSSIVSLMTTISYQGRLGLVLEFCESGSLEQLLRAHGASFLPEIVARRYMMHLHSALEYVHLSGRLRSSINWHSAASETVKALIVLSVFLMDWVLIFMPSLPTMISTVYYIMFRISWNTDDIFLIWHVKYLLWPRFKVVKHWLLFISCCLWSDFTLTL